MNTPERITVYIPQFVIKMVKALAKSRGISVSKLVRNLLLEEFFKERECISFKF